MPYCPKCGAELTDDMAFCPKCGYKLIAEQPAEEKKPEEVVEKDPEKTPEPAVKKEPKKQPEVAVEKAPEKEKKKNKAIIFIIIGLVVLALVAGLLFFLNRKCTVSFDTDGGTPVAAVKVAKGDPVSRPADPSKEGYDFAGWAYNGKDYNFNDPVTQSFTLKAQWNLSKYVTFLIDGKEIAKEHIINGRVTFPEAPQLEGYSFIGWQDKATMAEITEDQIFTDNTTLVANYKVYIPITSIKFEKSSYSMYEGETLQLKLSVKPSDWVESIGYATSDSNIASVSPEGIVTAHNPGKVTITVMSESGMSATTEVTVKEDKRAKSIDVADTFTVNVGESGNLNVKLDPADSPSKVSYKSSDTKIATVDSKGKVTGKKAGKCTVTVSTDNGLSKDVTVYVDELELVVSLNHKSGTGSATDGYLFYANNRPELEVYAKIAGTSMGSTFASALSNDEIAKMKMVGADKVLYWYAEGNEIYATGYGTIDQGFLRKLTKNVYFEYAYNGKTYKSKSFTLTVEPKLEVDFTQSFVSYNADTKTVTLTGTGDVTFRIRANQWTKGYNVSGMTLDATQYPSTPSSMPAYTYLDCTYHIGGSDGHITIRTDGGQELVLTIKGN